jgi:hypothetical protein
MRGMEKAEMRFLREIVRYRMTYHKRNEDIKEELVIRGINTIIKHYQKKWLEHMEKRHTQTEF